MELVRPGPEHLASYVAALECGWSPDNERGIEAAREELFRIETDAAAFLASMEDREAQGPPITLPDGTTAMRLPGFRRWLWDGEFCGSMVCGGSQVRQRCHRIVWGILGMRWCHGSNASDMQRQRWV
jgi:predicted acetyltransferase